MAGEDVVSTPGQKAAASFYHARQGQGYRYGDVCQIFNVSSFNVNDWRVSRLQRLTNTLEAHFDLIYILMILALACGAALVISLILN